MKFLCSKYESMTEWVIYQVYPRSFCDGNGDGIGDLRGVASKLDYLKNLGVNAIWLCPCYKSPNDDNGYDISDFYDIMDEFGTMKDFDFLMDEMKKRDMRLIMDLVPNHTSTSHMWFQEARKSKDNPYHSYYYWEDEIPNTWQSCFLGSAWEYEPLCGQYYLHSYAITQADLNWDNPDVRREMCRVVDFWVSKGVAGFRCDVIDQISKNYPNGNNAFGPHLHEYIHELFGRAGLEQLFTVGECWANDIEEVKRHCSFERGELTTLFQFDHFNFGRKTKFISKPVDHSQVVKTLSKWQNLTQDEGILYSIFTDNHDNAWFLSRFTEGKAPRYLAATCIAGMFYSLTGVPFIYQGQEIGQVCPFYDSIEDFDDIESINYYKLHLSDTPHDELFRELNFGSRDNNRRPMPWGSGPYGGFSPVKPWITPHSRTEEINVEQDLASDHSIYRFYKELLALRAKEPALHKGRFTNLTPEGVDYMIYQKTYEDTTFTIVCNFDSPLSLNTQDFGTCVLSNTTTKASLEPWGFQLLKKVQHD